MDQTAIYDIFVIGGGINGCGIARDAAGRGYSVYLAEMNDLASGTSSGSTKLIHGGLRYLEHYEFRLVRESLMEREVLWRMAPHIIWPLRFVLPLCRGPAAGLAAPARPVPLRPYRRAQAAAGDEDARHAQRSGRQAAEAAVQPRPSNIRIAGSTMRGWWRSMPATRPIAAPSIRTRAKVVERAPRRRSLDDRRRGYAQRRGRRGAGRGCSSMPPALGSTTCCPAPSARTTSTMCGWCRAAISSSRRNSTIRAPISSRTGTAASSSPSPTRTISR